jgi:hypothetical protein
VLEAQIEQEQRDSPPSGAPTSLAALTQTKEPLAVELSAAADVLRAHAEVGPLTPRSSNDSQRGCEGGVIRRWRSILDVREEGA